MTHNPLIDLAVIAGFFVAFGVMAYLGDKFRKPAPKQQATKLA